MCCDVVETKNALAFLGALILYLPLDTRRRCRSLATDGRILYVNPAYVLSLSFAETQFMLAHEALHCALGHFLRVLQAQRGAAVGHRVSHGLF